MVMGVAQTATRVLIDAGGASTTISFSSLPTAGHGVVVYFTSGVGENPTLAPTLADNQSVGNSYSEAIAANNADGFRAAVWRCDSIGATSGTFTVTITFHSSSNNYSCINMQEINQSITLDKTATQTTTVSGVTTLTGPALSSSDQMIACTYTEDSSGNQPLSADGSYTNVMNEPNTSLHIGASGDYKIVSVSTAPTCVYTSGNGGFIGAAAVMATFKPSGGSGAISGTAALTFGQTGALNGAGALAGSTPLTFGQAGALTGAGALNGYSTLTFGQTGLVTGAGALAGTTPLVFGQTGTLAGAGALAGATTITFGATGTLDQPGALVGNAILTFGQSGALTATGALVGSASLTFGASGTLDQPQASGGMGPMGPLYPSGRYIPMAANIGYDKPKKEELEEEVEEIEAVVEVAPPPKRPILTLKRPALDLPALQAIESEFSSLKSLAKAAQEVARLKKLQADDDEIVALLLL